MPVAQTRQYDVLHNLLLRPWLRSQQGEYTVRSLATKQGACVAQPFQLRLILLHHSDLRRTKQYAGFTRHRPHQLIYRTVHTWWSESATRSGTNIHAQPYLHGGCIDTAALLQCAASLVDRLEGPCHMPL